MTPIQRSVLDYIEQHIAEKRFAPTFQKIADHMGVKSKSGAHRVVNALISSGYLRRTGDRVGGFELAMPDLSGVPTAVLRAELESRLFGEARHG